MIKRKKSGRRCHAINGPHSPVENVLAENAEVSFSYTTCRFCGKQLNPLDYGINYAELPPQKVECRRGLSWGAIILTSVLFLAVAAFSVIVIARL